MIDPMDKSIVAVIPRQEPTTGKAETPTDWAKTKGRELTGQQPEPASSSNPGQLAGRQGEIVTVSPVRLKPRTSSRTTR